MKEDTMPEELPIACSLSGADLRDRLAEMKEAGRAGLIHVETAGGAAVLRFRASEGMSDRLDRIVAAESECCAFLDLSVEESDEALELRIAGPEGSEPVVEELVEAFTGRTAGAG
jgi:hypothetical protein